MSGTVHATGENLVAWSRGRDPLVLTVDHVNIVMRVHPTGRGPARRALEAPRAASHRYLPFRLPFGASSTGFAAGCRLGATALRMTT